MNRRFACAAAILCVLAVPAAARAQGKRWPPKPPAAPPAPPAPPPLSPEEEAKKRAQALFDEGMQHFGDGDYVVALEKFRQARTEFPSPKILVNIGTTLRQLGRNVEAAESYETYLRDPNQEPKRAEEVKRSLAELDAILGRLRVTVSKPGAEVRLDGKVLTDFTDGMTIRVDAGEHTLVGELAGFPPAVLKVTVAAKAEQAVELKIVPQSEKTVVVSRDAPVPKTQRTIGFVVGGVGVVGAGVGAVFGLLAKSSNDEAASYCLTETRCDPQGADLGDTARSQATVSTVVFAVAGAAIVTSAILLITAPSAKKAPPKRGFLAPGPGLGARW